MIEVIPGILESSFDEIQKKIILVADLIKWVHIDVLDDTLIPNVTYNNWGAFQVFHNRINLEAHLMVSDPTKYLQGLVNNGFKRIIVHVEANSLRDFFYQAKSYSIETGIAVDVTSDVELIEPFINEVDEVLIMTVKAGLSGQLFRDEELIKIRKINKDYPDLVIEVDGGIDRISAPRVIQAGATRIVSTSYLFKKNPDRIKEAIEELLNQRDLSVTI